MGQGDDLLQQLVPEDKRYEVAARELIKSGGKNKRRALIKAGFSASQASHDAYRITNDQKFIDALIKLSGSLTDKQLGMLSKGSLIQLLGDPKLELRTRIQAIRLGGEWASMLGQSALSVHLHEANDDMPRAVADMLAQRIIELKQQEAITVEVINAELPQDASR